MRGIVNGIDYNEWSPMQDVFLDTDGYTRFSMETMREGKAACKAALQRELGLPVDPNIPLLGFIGRLDYQKGVDLICDNYDWLMSQNVQLVGACCLRRWPVACWPACVLPGPAPPCATCAYSALHVPPLNCWPSY